MTDAHARPPRTRRARHTRGTALLAVSAGGALGATARYAAEMIWPPAPGHLPLTTLVVNVLGCALMGTLMVLVARHRPHPLVRLFAGTGVLGGFTTFSTYAVQSGDLLDDGHTGLAVLYLLGTLLAAVAALAVAMSLTQRLLDLRDGGAV